ncbi:MAG TPA: single-stranded-DNA-specific exonuclease RecJ [Longimicrobiales bacterium]|nr:single-stranded-DNA-specific exonuclease RecJ [Longimicrobiales bacterium]
MSAPGDTVGDRPGAPAATVAAAAILPTLDRRWVERAPVDEAAVSALVDALALPEALCRLLVLRGYADAADAKLYLKPRLERLHDPDLLRGMSTAVDRIERALSNAETILVHGDYDVDGVCSTALLTRVLRSMGGTVVPFTPLRLRDGYDLTSAGVNAAIGAGATLILTADCGTVAHAAIDEAAAAGIDVIVTDHHTPGPTLPAAVAVVNPNRPDCEYPDRGLAGVGVAFKLCQALAQRRGIAAQSLWQYLDLVAVATIADLAPLRGENRIMTRYGIRLLRESPNPGLRALIAAAGIDVSGPLNAGQISHVLAPRINAVGRMGDAGRGVALLLTGDEREAVRLAAVLEEENRVRKAVDRQTLVEAIERLRADYDPDRDFGVVIAAPGWHSGVIGIVASRVVERIHRPTILLAIDEATGLARGSARSIPRFHLYDAIRDCGHLLERFGGHRQAAGLDIATDRIDEFRAAFNERARSVLSPDDLVARVSVDMDVNLSDANLDMIDLLRHFGPFGMGNPSPLFACRGVRLARDPRLIRDEHAKLLVEDDTGRIDVIGFGMADRVRSLVRGDRIDIAFLLQTDDWSGRRRPQARLIDVRAAA